MIQVKQEVRGPKQLIMMQDRIIIRQVLFTLKVQKSHSIENNT